MCLLRGEISECNPRNLFKSAIRRIEEMAGYY
jgi:hypothetical protein